MTNTQEVPKKTPEKKVNLKYEREKDREIVKGIFRFYEVPGGGMSFYFRKYKGDPIERFDLVDGQVYSLPLGVAKHLNTNGWYPRYEYIRGEDGVIGGYAPQAFGQARTNMRVAQKVRRFGFQSLEFCDIDELSTPDQQVVQVEYSV